MRIAEQNRKWDQFVVSKWRVFPNRKVEKESREYTCDMIEYDMMIFPLLLTDLKNSEKSQKIVG